MNEKNSHAETLRHVSHDVEVNAGYFTFCTCKVTKTEHDKSDSTHFSVVVDYADHAIYGIHAIGVEFLIFPDDVEKTVEDLNQFQITSAQQQLIVDEVVAWANFNE